MQEPSKREVMGYIADTAEQLSKMCRELGGPLFAILAGAAELARDRRRKFLSR